MKNTNQTLLQHFQKEAQDIQKSNDFKNHRLPLTRIKKIMKSDEDVRVLRIAPIIRNKLKMIAAEAPAIFAKACELFIFELTLKAWSQTESNNRKILQVSKKYFNTTTSPTEGRYCDCNLNHGPL
jgi:nuclear transcription factor Y gamma